MSNKSMLDTWKSTPEYSADRLLREKAVMECLESLEAWVGSNDSITSAAAALEVLQVSNDLLGGSLGTFAGFLNEIRATQAEALDALHTQAGQLTAWVIAELWQPTHSRFPTDGQLGDETQLRFTQRWRKALRNSVFSETYSDQGTPSLDASDMPPNAPNLTNDRRLLYAKLRRRCKDAKQQVNQDIVAKRANNAWSERTWVKRWISGDHRVTATHDTKIRKAIQQWLAELEEKSPKSPKSPLS